MRDDQESMVIPGEARLALRFALQQALLSIETEWPNLHADWVQVHLPSVAGTYRFDFEFDDDLEEGEG